MSSGVSTEFPRCFWFFHEFLGVSWYFGVSTVYIPEKPESATLDLDKDEEALRKEMDAMENEVAGS